MECEIIKHIEESKREAFQNTSCTGTTTAFSCSTVILKANV